MLDLIIRNGRILDGTGGPWFGADLAVAGDRIAAVGRLGDREAASVIDAAGHFVCPGFVEEHSHADVCFMVDPLAQSAVRQGMTTMVVGHCGKSAAPVRADMLEVYRRPEPFYKYEGLEWTWETVGEYLAAVGGAQPSVNVVTLVGHLPVRQLVMGEANRPASPEERAAMRELVARALSEGARGFSTGLTEHHSVFADTDEVVGITQALSGTGWAYHCHMRNYTRHYLDAIREAIEIAERAGVPLVISHMYPAGRENWGQAEAGIELVEQARDRGLEAGFDVTPWRRGGGPFSQTLPQWVREGGIEVTLRRLQDEAVRSGVRRELEEDPTTSILPDWDDWLVCLVGRPENRGWLGRSIGEIAAERGQSPADAALLMLVEDDGGYVVAPTIKSDADVDLLLKHPLGVPTADGFALSPEGPLANQDRPNSYGTFPRVLGRYVRERGVLTWEEAVHKMTAVPAARVGLWDRGLLRPGMAADVVVFDPQTVIEGADYANPQEYPEGIPWVIVNGRVTVAPKGHTGARAGQVL